MATRVKKVKRAPQPTEGKRFIIRATFSATYNNHTTSGTAFFHQSCGGFCQQTQIRMNAIRHGYEGRADCPQAYALSELRAKNLTSMLISRSKDYTNIEMIQVADGEFDTVVDVSDYLI